jgi:N-acetylglucosamine-6-phosphate deacetylase
MMCYHSSMKMTDIHTHGIGGADTGTTSEDEILRIAEMHGSHGVAEIIPTVYSSSVETMRTHMLAITKAAERQGRPQDDTARIAGIHLEGPFLNPSKCGALDAATFLRPDARSLEALLDGFEDIVKIMTVAPELQGAPALIKRITDLGISASMGHSDATYAEAQEGFNAGARGITHLFNAMRGIHHREPGLAGFGLMNDDIYTEVIADPFHLDQRILELVFKVKNRERIIIISDTVKGAYMGENRSGIRDDRDTLLGGSMTIKESSERLINLGIDREAVYKAVAENPRRYLQGR